MGNTVSAAEAVAAGIAKPVTTEVTPPHNHSYNFKDAVPPPECPMHQKLAPPPTPATKEECPVQHRLEDEINPYNMVSSSCYTFRMKINEQIRKSNHFFCFVNPNRCHQPIKIQHPINRSHCQHNGKHPPYRKWHQTAPTNSGCTQASKCSGMLCYAKAGNGRKRI